MTIRSAEIIMSPTCAQINARKTPAANCEVEEIAVKAPSSGSPHDNHGYRRPPRPRRPGSYRGAFAGLADRRRNGPPPSLGLSGFQHPCRSWLVPVRKLRHRRPNGRIGERLSRTEGRNAYMMAQTPASLRSRACSVTSDGVPLSHLTMADCLLSLGM
jgi:hypothetical protein